MVRDPRLRKVENAVNSSPTLPNDNKQPIIKTKDDKKLDKPKRDNSKHRESKRKERSRSCSPSKKEPPRKTHKKTDRKERNLKDEKYHKRRDEKKNKELEIKKKPISLNVKVEQSETESGKSTTQPKINEKLFKEEPKSDINMDLPIHETSEINVSKDKDFITDVVNESDITNSDTITSELEKTDSLEDSDSLKRLHKYMQTIEKPTEQSTAAPSPLEMKNESDIHAVKSNKSKIKMSNHLYFIIKFTVGNLLLFLNKLDAFLQHDKIKTTLPFQKVLSSYM